MVAYLLTVQTQCGGREQDVVLPQRRKVHSSFWKRRKSVVYEFSKPPKRVSRRCFTRTSAAECSKPPRDPDFVHFANFSKKTQISLTGTMLDGCTLTLCARV